MYNLPGSNFRGLGLERIFVNFLKVYCDAGNLVLVLNTTAIDEVVSYIGLDMQKFSM